MIRYYEDTGLIPKSARRDTGYRDLDDAEVYRRRFIRRARDLGFTVEQIGELLALWSDRGRASADVKALALGHVEALKAKMAETAAMNGTLRTLAESCHGHERPAFPNIRGLAEARKRGGSGKEGVEPVEFRGAR